MAMVETEMDVDLMVEDQDVEMAVMETVETVMVVMVMVTVAVPTGVDPDVDPQYPGHRFHLDHTE
jgi:hypothetical protein